MNLQSCVNILSCVNLRGCVECNELLIANDRVLLSDLYCTCLEMHGRDGGKIPLTCRIVSKVNSLPSKEAIKCTELDGVMPQTALLISFW